MSAEQEVQTSNCSVQTGMKCVTYIYICDHLMWSKGLGGVPLSYVVYVEGRYVRKSTQSAQLNSSGAARHLFSAKTSKSFHRTTTTIPRLPETCHGRIHTPNHNSCVLDYSCHAQCPVGASRPRLQTQMGVQARDGFHMSLCTCKCVISLLFFFLSLIFLSFIFCFSLENAPLGLRGGGIRGQVWYQLIRSSTEQVSSPSWRSTFRWMVIER